MWRLFSPHLLWVLLTFQAHAELPKREFLVEIRHTAETLTAANADSPGYRIGTATRSGEDASQSVLVRNGEKGSLRWSNTVPVQWQQSAQSQTSTLTLSAASASSSAGSATQALHWFDVGQSLTVTPKWPGGKKDVALEIEVQQADIRTVHNADLPRQARNQLSTTITVPLNQWVTIAVSGKGAAAAGSYSSESGVDTRRLLQVRVLAP